MKYWRFTIDEQGRIDEFSAEDNIEYYEKAEEELNQAEKDLLLGQAIKDFNDLPLEVQILLVKHIAPLTNHLI